VKKDKVTKFSLGNTLAVNQAASRVVYLCFLPLPNRLFLFWVLCLLVTKNTKLMVQRKCTVLQVESSLCIKRH